MAAILRGNKSLILQPDQTVEQAADGSGVARLSYKCPWEKLNDFLPEPLQPHPVFPTLLLYTFTIAREPGDIGRYDCVFYGVLAKDPMALAQYDVSVSTSSEPVETHPRFAYPPETPPVTPAQLSAIELALQNNLSEPNPSAVPNPSAAYTLWLKKRRGIDSYLRVGTTFRKTYVAIVPPVDQYGLIGKIVDLNDANAPTPPKGQNYIATGVSWRKQAGVVTVTEESLLSGLGGWDTDLYDYTIP